MAYLLKSIPANCRAHGGFVWPTEPGAIVTAPDWDPTPECGGGLHGALNGAGNGALFCWDGRAVWIVAEIIGDDIVDLGGKVKVRQCRIIVAGTREDATGYLAAQGMTGVIGGTATAGDRGTATAGDSGIISVKWYDVDGDRYRIAVGYVGEDGIEPDVAYRVNNGKLERA